METALSVLSSLGFKQLRPGENQDSFTFSGPGIVVIACQDVSCGPAEIRFTLLTAISADNDALEVATRLLKQQWSCTGYVFALLAPVTEKQKRLSAIAVLDRMCSAGT